MKRVRLAALSIVACLLLAACGQASSESKVGASPSPPPAGTASGASSLAPGTLAPGTPSLTPGKPTDPGTVAAATTLSGTVEAGVEPNCLLLKGYLLVGGRRDVLRAGAKVTVTGRARPDLLTTCQQGTPFQVETVEPG